MSAACTIVIEQLEDGRYRATCPVFPDLETVAATEDGARQAFEAAIGRYMRQQLGTEEPDRPVTECL